MRSSKGYCSRPRRSFDFWDTRVANDSGPATDIVVDELAERFRGRARDVRTHRLDASDVILLAGNLPGLRVQALDDGRRGAGRHEQPGPGADVKVGQPGFGEAWDIRRQC